VDAQRSAELQVVLEGIPLPATRDELIRYARAQDAEAVRLLEPLPEGEYNRLDEVGEALMQPTPPPHPGQKLPRPESGKPPGGSDYLNPSPQSGAVRPSAPRRHPPEKVLQQQTELQQKQAERQNED
jgi:hypothetical protein